MKSLIFFELQSSKLQKKMNYIDLTENLQRFKIQLKIQYDNSSVSNY